ncbi:MFS efflux transporter [Aspergillus luchuensis]|uniref:MFS efflux transporter n=1 Tax=Aspergillus kawachii TaxID=1069201 RepID=A0A146F9F0_ASPKA|nr:MFS efflux transporter [Aspergillus luchuensis]
MTSTSARPSAAEPTPHIPRAALVPQDHVPPTWSSLELNAIEPVGSRIQQDNRSRHVRSKQPSELGKTFNVAPSAAAAAAAAEDSGAPGTDEITNPTLSRRNTIWRLASACLMNFGNGMNDSAPGALIPYIEEDYEIGYAVISLIFIANAVGFVLAAPLTHTIQTRVGHAKSYALSMSLIMAGYIAIVCHPPFPVVVTAFLLLGFGMALSIALNNVFCANLNSYATALGFFSGAYGIGGVISPLFATAMVSHGIRWTYFYFITLVISASNMLLAAVVFRNYDDEGAASRAYTQQTSPPLASQTDQPNENNSHDSHMRLQTLKRAIRNRTTFLGSLFIFAYQGAEVSISGWIVLFLINYRGGDSRNVGYVSAGFWAGITLGRFLLVYPAKRIGEKVVVGLLVVGAIAFQLMTWLIPNIVGDAVAVAVVGLLLGPMYPCSTAVFAKLLPGSIQLSSMSFITALGSSGGAVFPFLTGILSQEVGTIVLHPICLALYAVMVVCWCFLPAISKRSE